MNKSFFILGLAAMTLTACSSDEVVEVAQTEAIGFSPFVNKSTRATDLTTQTFTNFALWGVVYTLPSEGGQAGEAPAPVFINQKVEKSGETWQYSPTQYWVVGSNYRFSAIAPYDATSNGLTVHQPFEPLTDHPTGALTLTFDNSVAQAQKDVCYAFKVVQGATAQQGVVQLDFKHLLSRVKFKFVNNFPSPNTYLKIANVVIKDASAKGILETENLTSEQNAAGQFDWALPEGDATTFELPFSIDIPAGYPDAEGRFSSAGLRNYMETEHKYFIPFADNKQYTMSLTIEMYSLNTDLVPPQLVLVERYEHPNIKLPMLKYDSNNSYTFITEINASNISPDGALNPIVFTATVSDWESWNTDNEHDVELPSQP